MDQKYLYTDIRQSDGWFEFWKNVSWERIVFEKGVSARILKSVLGASIIVEKPQNINEETLLKIENFAKENKALILQIKPNLYQETDIFDKHKYDFVKDPVGTTKTGIIDLKTPLEDLYKKLPKTDRHILNNFKNEISVSIGNNYSNEEIDLFYKVYRQNGLSKKFAVHTKINFINFLNAFKNNSYLCTVRKSNNEYLGGCVFVCEGKTAWYMFSGMNNNGRKYGTGYFAIWNSIVYLKNKGYEFIDLEGLYDERYPKTYKNHQGYSQFKNRFQPDVVYYPKFRIKYFNGVYKLIDRVLM